MKARQLQKEQRKQAIISKGLELFISKGYTATKISDIAKSVGMSNGLFFHYYPNTEKLYEELVITGLEATKKITNNTDMPAILFFEKLSEFLLKEINRYSFTSQMFVLMNMAVRSDDTPQSVREIVSQVDTTSKLAILIKNGQEEGTIKLGNEIALANTFLSCLSGIAEQKVSNKEMILPESNWITDIIRK
jgi:AcrR family transcriptional regulator